MGYAIILHSPFPMSKERIPFEEMKYIARVYYGKTTVVDFSKFKALIEEHGWTWDELMSELAQEEVIRRLKGEGKWK